MSITRWFIGRCFGCDAFLFAIPTAPVENLISQCGRCGMENTFHPEITPDV